jgi:subtilisin-like proprotein convertase family protein
MQTEPIRRLVRVSMVTVLAAAALVAVGASPGAAAAVPCQQTFTNATSAPISPVTIPVPPTPIVLPPASGSSTVGAAAGTIVDVDVTVHITHPSADSFTLTVQHGLTSVILKAPGGTAGANFVGTTFDDEATQDISSGSPPYSGRFRPTSPLSVFDTTDAAGTWTLSAVNLLSISAGTIDSWSVVVTYAGTCNYDGDAVEDHSDACIGLAGATASGCPLASRGLTAKYRHGRFKGELSSTVPACRAAKSVTIWKVRRGPDRKIGTKTTRSDGSYKLRRARHRGRYYATSPRVVVRGVAECPAVRSRTFRIR